MDAVATYVAGGIDPTRSTVFLQSDVPQHMELAWYLTCVTPMGDLHRMTQFKEKSDQHKQNVNAGLFTYPVLMAADILVYRANLVPVGEDQIQHLELSREICRKWNARFGEVFPEPQARLSNTPRILGLDGKAKMSKSLGNAIGLLDPPELIEKKLKGRLHGSVEAEARGSGATRRFATCSRCTRPCRRQSVWRKIDVNCRSGALGCGDCKKLLAAALLPELTPIRESTLALRADPRRVLTVLREGGEQALSVAESTMKDVRSAMGLTTAGR